MGRGYIAPHLAQLLRSEMRHSMQLPVECVSTNDDLSCTVRYHTSRRCVRSTRINRCDGLCGCGRRDECTSSSDGAIDNLSIDLDERVWKSKDIAGAEVESDTRNRSTGGDAVHVLERLLANDGDSTGP